MSDQLVEREDVTCPSCNKTGRAVLITPEGPHDVLNGRDKPYVDDCPKGFKHGKDRKGHIVFTCEDCGVTATRTDA
jgi:hypothetical protein